MDTITKFPQEGNENFVTVVAIGPEPTRSPTTEGDSLLASDVNSSAYVTVLTIGNNEESYVSKDIVEEVLVYRLPGERLGFGLKFEGGTKANEFVKRLFIQSCAPDSPASRVESSWGKLTEGDEVLEIDCTPVTTMTRIDCVRCLKDSNVVIKLLVKHFEQSTRSEEDLPQVISAEKKRTLPPPPPVPPRKIPKKVFKANVHQNVESSPIPAARQINEATTSKTTKFQSPRSSGRAPHSPDIFKRDRRFSNGSIGPPDAEVYVDLFSQESTQSLSESDDTGSSISTVVDRFGSFPTTTSSSLAGSLPSTPTSVQKHIDIANLLNSYQEEDFSPKATIKQGVYVHRNSDLIEKDKSEEKFSMMNEDGSPLRPPSSFQDAPLSYGNEDMRIIDMSRFNQCEEKNSVNNKHAKDNHEKNSITNSVEERVFKKPPVPPRSRDLMNAQKKDLAKIHDENMNIPSLPRLVDFVPKSTNRENFENPTEIINIFLANERRDTDYVKKNFYVDDTETEIYNSEVDLYSSKWSLSSQLATIGEVEEEGFQELNSNRSPVNSTPILIVENADNGTVEETTTTVIQSTTDGGINGKMETFSSDSRQPPDGHEFPDYVEVPPVQADEKYGRENVYSQQLGTTTEPVSSNIYKSVESTNSSQEKSSFNDFPNVPIQNMSSLNKANSVSSNDLNFIISRESFDSDGEITVRKHSLEPSLHTRSQSLIDMSTISKQKPDRWTLLAEQRKKGYSKLKGLVIPEHLTENEPAPVVNIPEIISHTLPLVLETKINTNETRQCHLNETEPVTLPPTAASRTSFPKYSPAFKRRGLQVYSQPKEPAITQSTAKSEKSATLKNKIEDEFRLDNLSDSPKSLESITSPTRSDCSFDYITSSFAKIKSDSKQSEKTHNYTLKSHKDVGKSEDESDNDSAVSSSQSSYVSRCSPPPSPTRSCEMLDYESNRTKSDAIQDVDKYNSLQCRLLKAASVEAINRKNILASAKCRSGRDLKVGSPVIQRKYDGDDSKSPDDTLDQSSVIITCQPAEVHNEKRSINCEESTDAAVINGNAGTISNNNDSSENRISENNNLLTLEPAAESLKSISVQSKETKVPTKDNIVKPYRSIRNNKPMSVTDLRKNFEMSGVASTVLTPSVVESKPKSVKIETKARVIETSSDKKSKTNGEVMKLDAVKPTQSREQKQADKEQQKESVNSNRRKVTLHPEFLGGSIGITLAGGTDYETKEITVHKIRYGSVAYNDGTLKKGDRIISINGKAAAGLTHAESVEMLKKRVSQFVLIIEDGKEESLPSPKRKSFIYEPAEPKGAQPEKSATHVFTLTKDGAGLGFSIEGGRDSPNGDLPLRVKKIFQGGPAEKGGELTVGDELLAISDTSVTNLSRIEAWTLMKKLPDGDIKIQIYR